MTGYSYENANNVTAVYGLDRSGRGRRCDAFEKLVAFFCRIVLFLERPAVQAVRMVLTVLATGIGCALFARALLGGSLGWLAGFGVMIALTLFFVLGMRDGD